MTRAELIAALEKLEGPSREMDAWIWCVVFGPAGAWVEQSPFNFAWCIYEKPVCGKRQKVLVHHKPGQPRTDSAFTSSIDSALTLVPEGTSVHLHIMPRQIGHKAVVGIGNEAIAKTPAIALTIAALKAQGFTNEEA